MQIIIVQTKAQAKAFLEMPIAIYKNDPNYIQPLMQDVESVFDEQKNKFFKHGICERWLVQNDEGKYIARLAVFINYKYKQSQATGGIGFFECVNDDKVAHFLFDAAIIWHKEKGMHAVDGPINFGERDRWWGCLVEGFDEPLYCMNYNPSYYCQFFENYGFKVYFNQLCFGITEEDGFDEKYFAIADRLARNKDFKVEHIKKNNLDKYAEDFCMVYNAAFAQHGEGKSIDVRVAKKMFATMKTAMDEQVSWFVYFQNKPIAVWLNLPDLNQYFKKFNGQLRIMEKLRFLWMQKFSKVNRLVGLVYGVAPEWQGKGIDVLMIAACRNYIATTGAYSKYEMQWIGDFNPKMINLAKNLNGKVVRRLSTYRFLFDRTIPFERMKNVGK